jgi:hypothetical protein
LKQRLGCSSGERPRRPPYRAHRRIAFACAAFAINDLLKPASVIFTHVNEAATQGGKLKAGTQTAAVMKQVETPAYLAVSERTMEFDGKGKCVSGC